MRFQAPQLGALGVTFTAFRAMQFASLVAIVGITANFINDIVTSGRDTPDVLVGTLTVASIATLYVSISYILYYDGLLPLVIAAGIDLALLIAAIVVAVTIGKPLSLLKCELLPQPVAPTQTFTMSISARDYTSAAARYNNYLALITTDQPHCYEVKAVWGLSIALCVLFAFSAVICGYAGARGDSGRAAVAEKSLSGFGFPRQISGPTALGTQLLTTKAPDRWIPPPQPARRPLFIRQVDEDVRSVRLPPVIVNANSGPTIIAGQPLESNIAAPVPAVVPAARSYNSSNSSQDYIPIAHKPSYGDINDQKRAAHPPIAVIIPPTPSDDGFTPITPTPASPEVKDYRLSRVPPLPRDALGIPVGKFFTRAKSNKVQIQHEEEYDDVTPLSPKRYRDLETQAMTKPKPKRRTLWGVIEGWWDLGLLEKGMSLRRKG
ncbi:uncharacterized protein F4812DRAFT_468043 [Daldinia caldariorum]|uniref:uncharacterized protein n=1 Tax=Daldinia caldariorum TaxID=326644 RepID=UPI002008372C|nr:uncharacterized protein F4812DRAFT_468043 [Daldinia caldariorum]KAI1464418.1 hypothetical protein F4812DRAFT_468043 [Daldinia caldariorum]